MQGWAPSLAGDDARIYRSDRQEAIFRGFVERGDRGPRRLARAGWRLEDDLRGLPDDERPRHADHNRLLVGQGARRPENNGPPQSQSRRWLLGARPDFGEPFHHLPRQLVNGLIRGTFARPISPIAGEAEGRRGAAAPARASFRLRIVRSCWTSGDCRMVVVSSDAALGFRRWQATEARIYQDESTMGRSSGSRPTAQQMPMTAPSGDLSGKMLCA